MIIIIIHFIVIVDNVLLVLYEKKSKLLSTHYYLYFNLCNVLKHICSFPSGIRIFLLPPYKEVNNQMHQNEEEYIKHHHQCLAKEGRNKII